MSNQKPKKRGEGKMISDFFYTFKLELQPRNLKYAIMLELEEVQPTIIKFLKKYAKPRKT